MAPAKKNKKKNSKKKQAKKKPSIMMRLFKWMVVLGLWGIIALTGILLWFAKDLPDITTQASFERRSSIVVKAANDTIIGRYGESKGQNINVNDVPHHLVHAILSIEDRRFYNHFGIDPLGITRAMITNVRRGRLVQGGSTITQQLAKNLFLTHQRKLKRKIQEALLAIWLERELSKDEILSAYMNRVYLGAGTYGFEAASQLYFGKSARYVTVREAAVLAGLLKAPSKYSPHSNPELAKKRSDVVINAMVDAGFIKKSELSEEQLTFKLPQKPLKSGQDYRYFTDWVVDGLDDLVGRPDIDMIVETTLISPLQDHAQNTLKQTIDNADEMSFVSQGAVLSMAQDGAILAMVGGYDYRKSQFNRTTQAIRPPGSSFKPIIFLTAIEQGWDTDDKILDEKITQGSYRPKNFANKYYGEVELTEALSKSMNTASVRLMQEAGIGNVLKTSKKLGIISPLQRDLSLSLGSSGLSMLEMGTAYTTLSNGGYRVFPYAITRITDKNGRVLYQRKKPSSYQHIIRTKHVSKLTYMMQDVIENGTGRRAKLPFPAAGKTGTSQNNRDAWFAGYTDKMTTIVWMGNDDNSPMRSITGGNLPASIWRNVMMFGNNKVTAPSFARPEEDQENNFSTVLKRLFSSDNSNTVPKPKRKNDYSNLND